MNKKVRISIPHDTATEILYLSDRTCCVCNERGKVIQIHHIDENPSNNSLENLSVLCLECHNETMIKGGFGRKLEAQQIIKYSSAWIERVKNRRIEADKLFSIKQVNNENGSISDDKTIDFLKIEEEHDYIGIFKNKSDFENKTNELNEYLNRILIIHKAQMMIAQTNWDRGVTGIMNQANYDMVAFYQEILIELSTYYSDSKIYNENPEEFFSEIITSRFSWHRFVLEPNGSGTGGTMISVMVGGSVMEDLRQMILDMVNTLSYAYSLKTNFDFQKWKSEWLNN
jgi:hypothetical protein